MQYIKAVKASLGNSIARSNLRQNLTQEPTCAWKGEWAGALAKSSLLISSRILSLLIFRISVGSMAARLFWQELELRGYKEAEKPQHPQGIFRKAFMGIAYRPQDPPLQVAAASVRVDEFPGKGVIGNSIDGEIRRFRSSSMLSGESHIFRTPGITICPI